MGEDYRRFFELSLDLLCVAGADGYFKTLNAAWERTLGWTIPELMAKPYLEFVHPDDRRSTAEQAASQGQGRDVVEFQNRYRCKDGSYRWLMWQATRVQPNGLVYAVARDVTAAETKRGRLEAQLYQAQKMEAVGRLAAGVAHDFNNVLTAISGYCHFLLEKVPEEERADVQGVLEAAERATSLTRQLLAFSRTQVLQPRIIDLNTVVKGLNQMLRRTLGENILLFNALEPDPGLIRADPGQMEQIIVNLVINSRDAIPGSGKITIETAGVNLDEEYAKTHPGCKPGPHVMLAISDTGAGMNKATVARLFEPFFTTKPAGKGTGLGLCTVHGIVKQSGGSIYVYSEPGQGTTFKIFFPRVEAPKEALAPALRGRKKKRGSELVLLVEDDEQVRRIIIRFLETQGYSVLSARDPAEALELFSAHRREIALLLTDIMMPGMRGDELAKVLLDENPKLRVLFTSGYTQAGIVRHDLVGPRASFIPKPLDLELMAEKIRELLDAVSPST